MASIYLLLMNTIWNLLGKSIRARNKDRKLCVLCYFFFFFGGGTVLLPIQELHELLFCYIINRRKQLYFHGLILMNLTNRIRIVSLTRKTSWHPLEENHILEGRCDGADDPKRSKTLFTQSLSVLSFLILVHSTPSTGTKLTQNLE